MTRGNVDTSKVIYKGNTSGESFVVFVDSVESYEAWKKDESTPLAQVVSGSVFTAHKQGGQGIMDKPSNIALDNEFNTTDEDAIIKKILRDGTIQVRKNPERQGDTNMTMGSQGNH